MKSLWFYEEVLPQSGRTSSLLTSFNDSLCSSFNYLLDACKSVIENAQFNKAKEVISKYEKHIKLPGFLSILHFELLDAAQNENIQKIQKIIVLLIELEPSQKTSKFINFDRLDEFYQNTLKGVIMESRLEVPQYFNLMESEFFEVKNCLMEAINCLWEHFPHYGEEMNELVSEILLLKGTELKAGSGVSFYGMIYINTLYKCRKLYEALDVLVHETSHLYFHLLNHQDELILNPSEFYESPLRKEPRPLIGTFHATFVLLRIIDVLKQAIEKDIIPSQDQSECNDLINYYTKRASVGLKLIEQHGKLTKLGSEIINNSKLLFYEKLTA